MRSASLSFSKRYLFRSDGNPCYCECYLTCSLSCPRRVSAARTVTMKHSCLRAARRSAGGRAWVAPTGGAAWRDDAAAGILSKTTEVTARRRRRHAALTLMEAATGHLAASVLKTSAKGEEHSGRREEMQNLLF